MLRYVSMPYFANYEIVRPSYCLRPLCNEKSRMIPTAIVAADLISGIRDLSGRCKFKKEPLIANRNCYM